MPRSDTSSRPSDSIWLKIPAVSAIQIAILLAVAVAVVFAVYGVLEVYRSGVSTTSDASVSAPDCRHVADTFDKQRQACLRRRWSAMREMKPWPDAPRNAQLEECLKSATGEVAVPFKTNSCTNSKIPQRQQRAQN